LAAAGIASKVIAERLGHDGTRITDDTYSHLRPGIAGRSSRIDWRSTADRAGRLRYREDMTETSRRPVMGHALADPEGRVKSIPHGVYPRDLIDLALTITRTNRLPTMTDGNGGGDLNPWRHPKIEPLSA
jgi:hypothetical protein